ncbi:MAG: two-component system sensor histidine kinase KdpD [Sulfuricellaceae bacterium]
METDRRPDPDALLERIKEEERKAQRGKLKIFFGASAGVGKTYAMLSAARQLRSQVPDVLVGIVETHGRAETMALLDGLDVLPLREIEYRGRVLKEFDLDGALARHPALMLVDELAHSNVPGSRHPKRWQDVEELLAAGIDVYTTVNVQHLETLNDVVGGITGIRIGETVPDKVFDQADEVVLVDISPDELLQRLKEGKVYMPQQAERAIKNFFRKGNLIALRELALRQTANRVDDQMRAYRRDKSIAAVWQTRESLLVCVGPYPGAEKIVRSASRIASQLGVEWHAVYVETPKLQRLPEAERERILRTLRLAQELGAKTASLPGQEPAQVIVDYARSHNLTKVVVGRVHTSPWTFWRRPFADRIGLLAPDLDFIQIAREETAERLKLPAKPAEWSDGATLFPGAVRWAQYGWAAGACAFTALAATLLLPYFDLANIVMLFLLAVVLVAVKQGRGPAVLAAFLSVASFDFFFVSPRFSFAVGDVQYLLTFAVMLAVALITGQLTANLRYQARVASNRELRSRALYEMARDLSAALQQEQITSLGDKAIKASFGANATILLPDEHDKLMAHDVAENGGGAETAQLIDLGVAQWSFDHAEPAGFGTDTLPASSMLYMPLRAPMRTRGVLAVKPLNKRWSLIPEQRRQLEAFAALIATALERVHYIEVAQTAIVKIESERLRNSVLSALSHDLRTPLTVLVGVADSLALSQPPLGGRQSELAATLRIEAVRMSALVDNLLDMARLQAGEVKLNRQWQPFEEVVGSSLKARRQPLSGHRVQVALPADLPLLEFDAVLIERVLCNLLENAAKYTPPGSNVRLEAGIDGDAARISVADNGPGLSPGSEETIFEKFTRGERESTTPGVGLGLAICRAIVKAHKGRIWAENVPSGGARFVFTLPLGAPPTLPGEAALEETESSRA